MTANQNQMSAENANAVFDILVTHAGAHEPQRDEFVHRQTQKFCREYRFGGSLGSGGKFKRGTGTRTDGTYGEWWHLDAYPEDTTDARRADMAAADPLLDVLRTQHETTTSTS